MPRVYPRKSTKFCFTRHCDPGASWEDECDAMIAALASQQCVVYALFNCEISPSTGRHHLQGCFKLNNPRSFDWVHENLMTREEWIEECRSWPASIKYCRKEESQAPGTTPTSFGDVSETGLTKHGGHEPYSGSFYPLRCLELLTWEQYFDE